MTFCTYLFIYLFLCVDLLDLEDIGVVMRKQKQTEKKAKEASLRLEARDGGREMVTKLQRRALTKEGYRIIGTHSAVKLCRWTKVWKLYIIFLSLLLFLFSFSITFFFRCTFSF